MTEKEKLDTLFDELKPIMRSITGPGIEQTINIFSRHMPLKMEKTPTGTRVFDWCVPPEWHFTRGRIISPAGEVICDSRISNLHVVNYSVPVDRVVSREELDAHLHSDPELPDAIPYVTSYYKRDWGFCISHNEREKLPRGEYHVLIDACFDNTGGVPYAHFVLEGESKKEVLISSYICHPTLANNELSGPLVLLALYDRIRNWPKRRYTYRFLLNPETIGSLCYLYSYGAHLKENLAAGLILTCLGGPNENLVYKSSRQKDSLINRVMHYEEEQGNLPIECIPFDPRSGSDERQYCSPGFNLPVGQISRTTYATYNEYHNSLDTKDFMGIDPLIESANGIEAALQHMEVCGTPVNMKPFGEPHLGKYDLYPHCNSAVTSRFSSDKCYDGRKQLNTILCILSSADGETDLIDMARSLNCSIEELIPCVRVLEEAGLLAYNRDFPVLQAASPVFREGASFTCLQEPAINSRNFDL
ncbi:MAG: DUF4910 domain-containing protein [Fibrobacterota bacterium]